MKRSAIGNNLVSVALVVSVLILGAYAVVYQLAPFSGSGNDVFLSVLSVLAALFAAVTASRVFFSYQPGDMPRAIWLHYSAGVWMWFLSELVWYYDYLTFGEVASPSAPDVGWIVGYIFFTIAFYKQYKPFYRGKTIRLRWAAVGIWLSVILVAVIISRLFGEPTLSSLVNYYYAVADLAIGVFAAHTLWKFRGGALARPWLGLFVFTFSDLAYAISVQTGVYAWYVDTGNPLTLLIDLTYVAAYLFLAVGFLAQYTLIRYASYTIPKMSDD